MRVGEEYGEKSKVLERDRKGEVCEFVAAGLACDFLSYCDFWHNGDPVESRGSTRLFWVRGFGAVLLKTLSDGNFGFSSRAFSDIKTLSSGNGAKPKNRLLCAEKVWETREKDRGSSFVWSLFC